MFFRRSRRKAWSALLLSATFSAALLSFAGTSDGQQTTNPQQMLETTLQRQQQELEQLLKQHEVQRQALTRSIDQLGSVVPVDNAAVSRLHAQLTKLHKRQQEEKQSLSKRQTAESNVLRGIVNPQPGGATAPAVDINDPEVVENERIAHLKLVPGVTKTDAAGVPVEGSVAILVSGETFDLDVAIAGLLSAADVSVIEVRHAVTDELIASMSGGDLRSVGGIPRPAETEVGAVAEPMPEWLMMDTGFAATPSVLQALANDQLQVIVKSAQYPNGFLKGTFGLLDMDKLRGLALHKESLPIPVVVDRSFTKLGTVNELVIQDETAAIQLGKALFWDVQVGADNKTACATCHNFGGADWRTKNQLASGGNRELKLADFLENDGRLDDIVGSQGVVQENHVGVDPSGRDHGEAPTVQELVKKFTLDGTVESRTRQVTGRNTPSVINAAFYARQFWDGRAHRFFNGENIFGTQDPNAGVWENNNGVVAKNTNFLIDYSSLASQAVGPVGSSVEMAHGPDGARSLPELGKKMLDASTRPLGLQKVHASDSVLSSLVAANGVGLNKSYAELIRQAFKPQFWNYEGGEVAGHTQMEANFALFFGLAVQAYERTLISDESRFDKFVRGQDVDLTYDEKEGLLRYFNSSMGCTACHDGAMFSAATWGSLSTPVEAMSLMNTTEGLYDNGFYNVGVQDQKLDAGIGRMDLPFGPISLSKLATGVTNSNMKVAPAQQWPNLSTNISLPAKVEGMFKTPTLRNVELTAPYFHTGNYATLEDTMNFYADGGDFPANPHLDDDMHPIRQLLGYPERVAQLAAFLRTLTDERVRHRSAPFDGPELAVPNGHSAGGNGTALDDMVVLEATGSQGTSVAFPMFTDRIGVTTPKSGSSSMVGGSVAQATAGMTADQLARARDAQMNQLNQQMNQAQAQFNAETQAVNAQLNSGAITPEQQNAMLADINARRNAAVEQINNQMAQVNATPNGVTPPVVTPPVVTPPVVTPPVVTPPVVTPPVVTPPVVTPPVVTPPVVTPPVVTPPVVTPPVVTPPVVTPPVVTPPVVTPPVVTVVGNPVVGPVESLVAPVTGTLIVSDRRPGRSRTDVTIIDLPVAALSNTNGFIIGGVVPADLATTLNGLTVEYLDANDNVIAVSQQFVTESGGNNLITLAMSVRDPAELTLLDAATQVRVLQTESVGLGVRVLATVGYPVGTAVITVATPPVVTPPVVTPPVVTPPVVTPPVVTPPVVTPPVVTPPVVTPPVVTPPVVTPPVVTPPVVTPPVVTPPVVTPPFVFNPGNVPLVGNLVAGPAESLVGPVSGTLIVSDRRPLRSRTNVTIIDVPVGSFSNNNGFFNGGVVPADLATTLSGLTVEYLDANGNVIAVSQQFVTESAGIPGLVTIAMSVRDPAELTLLDAATQVRVLQSEPTGIAVRVLATVGYPDGTAAIAVP